METERKIEKLLRALGRKRREQANEPFKLHPANRRLLQAEVRTVLPLESRKRRSFWLFRAAPVFGMLAILAMLVALLLPALSRTKHRAQSTLVSAPQLKAESEIELKQVRTMPPGARSEAVVLNTPEPISSASGSLNKGTASLGVFSAEDGSDAARERSVTSADRDSNASLLPASLARRADGLAGEQNPSGFLYFRRVSDSGLNRSSVDTNILSRFNLQQTASNFLVVDADGSIYRSGDALGSLLVDELRVTNVLADRLAPGGSNSAANIVYRFVVSGTNRTLNRNVVFNGALYVETNAAAGRFVGEGGAVGGGVTWTNLRGTALLGGTVEFPIDAVRIPTNNLAPGKAE